MLTSLQERVKACCKFKDNTYYLLHHVYFDIIAQVHSVAITKRNCQVLRVWRAQKLGPEENCEKREARAFRVTQDIFQSYILPPAPRLCKAIDTFGKRMLLEITVYGDHQNVLKLLKSGDYVALQNVHAGSCPTSTTLTIHTGVGAYNRGISIVPEEFENDEFQEFRELCEVVLEQVTDFEGFKEFSVENEESEAVNQVDDTKEEEDIFAKPCNKIVIANEIAVDYFAKSSKCNYHFLTHAHTDHCRGINFDSIDRVYCSPDTAAILPQILGLKPEEIPEKSIYTLELMHPYKFDGFEVTLLDAFHCPGAVMYLFEGGLLDELLGGPVLCTGDFRADKHFFGALRGPLRFLTELKFSRIYLDNTYFSLDMEFPQREHAQALLKKVIKDNAEKNIYIPLHRLGREELIQNMSKEFMEPFGVYEEKLQIAEILKFNFKFGVEKPLRKIQVVKKNKWKCSNPENSVIIDVSMLHNLIDLTQSENGMEIVRIPYSDHSSRSEILEFLKAIHFESIYPTSKKYSKKELKMMMMAGKGYRGEMLESQIALHQFVETKKTVPNPSETSIFMAPNTSTAASNDASSMIANAGCDSENYSPTASVFNDFFSPAERNFNEIPHAAPPATSTSPAEPPARYRPNGRIYRDDYPEDSTNPVPIGVEWQDNEWEYMSGDLDLWPEGPPKSVEECIYRVNHRKRRRRQMGE